MQKRNPFILIVITLFLGLSLLVINNYPQVKSFTLEQITNAVRAVKAKRITARTLINDIRKQKVDFTLNKDDEAFLRAEGATQEIIKAILDNGPGGGGITPPLNTPFTIVEIYDKLKENKSPEAQKTLIEQIQKRKVTDKLDPDTQSFLIQDGATIELIDAISKNPAVGDSNSANPTDPKQPPTTPFFTNSIGMEFMLAPKGSFLMGSNLVEDEQPIRKVTFAKEFLIGRYEVTQGEWEALMGNAVDWLTAKKNLLNANQTDPLKKIDFNQETLGDNYPMFLVSWEDAQTFITKLNALNDGYVYSLPSEAEWEYACKAGTDTRFAFGDVITTADASFKINFPPPLKRETPDKLINKVKPVGLYQPNPWGIYDMHGNLTEWCLDIYSGYKGYLGLPVDGSPNTSKGDQSVRIKRGGNWISPSFTDLRSARRDYRESSFANMGTGFRVVAKKK